MVGLEEVVYKKMHLLNCIPCRQWKTLMTTAGFHEDVYLQKPSKFYTERKEVLSKRQFECTLEINKCLFTKKKKKKQNWVTATVFSILVPCKHNIVCVSIELHFVIMPRLKMVDLVILFNDRLATFLFFVNSIFIYPVSCQCPFRSFDTL